MQSGEGSASFNNDNSANFPGAKKYNKEFQGVFFFYNTRKNFKSNLVLVFSSSNLKVSNSLLNDQAPIVQKVDTAIDFPTSPLDSNLSSE